MDREELLITNKYFVLVIPHATKKDVIQTFYPKNNILKLDNTTYQYWIHKKEIVCSNLTTKEGNTIQLLDYEIRPCITIDILVRARNRKLDQKLIVCLNKDDERSRIYDILPKPKRINLETQLLTNLGDFVKGKQHHVEPNILPSYKKILNFISKGKNL